MRTRPVLSILILTALCPTLHSSYVPCETEPAFGARCTALPVCGAFERATVVFVGEVTDKGTIEHEVRPGTVMRGPQRVRFKIVERFRGFTDEETEIEAEILGTSAETVFITRGGRHLVYAREVTKGKWDTSCTPTKPLQTAADEEELKQVRACARR